MTTALNLARRTLRNRPTAVNDAQIATEPLDSDLRIDVVDALQRLPLRQRQAVVLHYLADLPVAAVADLMNASDGSVKTHLSRARQKLGTILLPPEPRGNA